MSNQFYDLRPLWDAILDLYGRFDAYCKKHQLRYYVTGGTLLGAVRHNGFIPWDDDFDVVMPRPDYLRFIELVRTARIADAEVKAKQLDPSHLRFFAKVMETRGEVVELVKMQSKLDLKDGIWIDVIPIDGMPKSAIPFYWWALKRSAWKHFNERSWLWRMCYLLCWSWVKDARSPFTYEKWLTSYDYETSPAVEDFNANGRRFKLRCLTAASFGAPVWHAFDRIQVPMPAEWDKFLQAIYGDYMRLPPEEKRRPSHQLVENLV